MSDGVYIAGASIEYLRVKRFAIEVAGTGWRPTHAWWEPLEEIAIAGYPEEAMTEEARDARATADFEGVARAKILILLVPAPEVPTKNSWIELGYAFGLTRHRPGEIQIWLVGEAPEDRFFSLKADRHFKTEGECLAALVTGA